MIPKNEKKRYTITQFTRSSKIREKQKKFTKSCNDVYFTTDKNSNMGAPKTPPPRLTHQFSSLLSPSEAVNVALPCHSPSRRVPLRVAPDAPRRREEPDLRPCLIRIHLMKVLFMVFFKDYLVVSKVLSVACLPVVGGRALCTTSKKIDIIF